MANSLQIFTFGQLDILLNGHPIENFPTRKVEALLIYLACTGKAHPREYLADFLWDERSHEQSLKNLRSSLSYLNRSLSEYLHVTRQSIAIHPDAPVWVDTKVFFHGLAQLEVGGKIRSDRTAEEIRQICSLYRGDFLHGFFVKESKGFDTWLLEQRQRIHKQMLQALSQLVDYYLDCGDYTEGINHVLRLLQLDPLYEEAHRQYMKLLAQTGQRSAALAQYEACRQILVQELETEPEQLTTELYQEILAGNGQKTVSQPTLRQHFKISPIQTTTFLGREEELKQIRQHLIEPNCRILSLIGLGGVGKTRLAYQIAEEMQNFFANGVCFVSLAGLNHPEQLLTSLAETLRFSFSSSNDPKNQLLNYLRDKEMLIVFDNCEHLLEGMVLLSEIIKGAAAIKILTTTREQLSLQGEWLMNISGLDYSTNASSANFEKYPAIALFLQSAKRVQSNYQLDDYASLIQICDAVKGMPLAIEMAAAWTSQMSTAQIAAQIHQDLDVLSSKLRDIPERHRSIRLLFEHSWNLLAKEEQRQFMCLAVFRGKISQEAAYAVGQLTIGQLDNLFAKSLIQSSAQGVYGLHDLLRRFALEKLEASGQFATTANQHAAYFCNRLKALHQDYQRQKFVHEQIRDDYDNYAVAMDWSYRSQNLELLSLFIQRLAGYWETNFKISEALLWIDNALELNRADTPTAIQAKIFTFRGVFLRFVPKMLEATTYLERGIAIAHQIDDSKLLLEGLHGLGHTQHSQGLHSEAMNSYEQQLAIAESERDEYQVGRAYYNIGSLALEIDKLALARERLEAALHIYRKHHAINLSLVLGNLGLCYYLEQNIAQAEYYYQECLAAARIENNPYAIIAALVNSGEIAVDRGKDEAAIELYLEAFETSLDVALKPGQFASLEALAILLSKKDHHSFATLVLASVDAQRQINHLPLEPYNYKRYTEALNKIREAIGASQFEVHWNRGYSTEFQKIVQQILNRTWEYASENITHETS